MLLTRGNSKVGDGMWTWNLPAIDTCPGRTPTCVGSCYATRNRWLFPSVRARLVQNGRAALDPLFPEAMILDIRTRQVELVRIHGSGDFFDTTYVRRWGKVLRNCPATRFLCYTRSWRVFPIRVAIETLLAPMPNLSLWYSADASSGWPENLPERVRVAWLQADPDEPIPEDTDLVFRTHRLRTIPVKRIGLSMVCPRENGTPAGREATCSTCKFCL